MNDLHRRAEEEWLAPTLWTGAVRTHGAAGIALVGSPEEIAAAILEYKRAGVSQFIFSGWPKVESMEFFGSEILPIIRRMERADNAEPGPPSLDGKDVAPLLPIEGPLRGRANQSMSDAQTLRTTMGFNESIIQEIRVPSNFNKPRCEQYNKIVALKVHLQNQFALDTVVDKRVYAARTT